jgi:hypothetical protein
MPTAWTIPKNHPNRINHDPSSLYARLHARGEDHTLTFLVMPSAMLCLILASAGEAESGSAGEQPAKE